MPLSEDLEALEELPAKAPGLEVGRGEEVVQLPIDLARPRRPRGGRDAADQRHGGAGEHLPQDRGLPRAGRPRNDNQFSRRTVCHGAQWTILQALRIGRRIISGFSHG